MTITRSVLEPQQQDDTPSEAGDDVNALSASYNANGPHDTQKRSRICRPYQQAPASQESGDESCDDPPQPCGVILRTSRYPMARPMEGQADDVFIALKKRRIVSERLDAFRRRREKKLMTTEEVNEKFPLTNYKTWRSNRADEGLPIALEITTSHSFM
ncbi:hypothetical protein AYL99_11943 [Fonsecaea erecta]|uniref:Uncharacterized protein n=1 Tax=Fonsecaea erecta TaxID=1367422 RepID=A0A178Z331_9EURO|nr:hypothetical protein AYL99_11943 [Fonsecaea erecta]OAP53921.1 hypothetical protein AYL99_11943 [Fonsecaea erecta]